jgi:hypothetical protein
MIKESIADFAERRHMRRCFLNCGDISVGRRSGSTTAQMFNSTTALSSVFTAKHHGDANSRDSPLHKWTKAVYSMRSWLAFLAALCGSHIKENPW